MKHFKICASTMLAMVGLLFVCCLKQARSAPAGPVKETVLKLNISIEPKDFVVYSVSEADDLLVGKFEVWSDQDEGRTVLTRFHLNGDETGKFVLPEGYFACAIFETHDYVYAIVRDATDHWRIIKLTLSGTIVWDHLLDRLLGQSGEKLRLSFDATDWQRVQIVKKAKPNSLALLWQSESCEPPLGTISFSCDTGRVDPTTFDAVTSELGAIYRKEGASLERQDNATSTKLRTVETGEHADWRLDYLNGKLVIQVENDAHVRSLRYAEGANPIVSDADLPFGVRNNGTLYYIFDPSNRSLRIFK